MNISKIVKLAEENNKVTGELRKNLMRKQVPPFTDEMHRTLVQGVVRHIKDRKCIEDE